MPAGTTHARPPVKVIERATAQACIAIARKVQAACLGFGDPLGSDAARQIARLIEEELLEGPLHHDGTEHRDRRVDSRVDSSVG